MALAFGLAITWLALPAASAEPLGPGQCFKIAPMCEPGYVPLRSCSSFSQSTCTWSCVRKG